MAYEDFRGFLAALRAHGELIEVDRRVDPNLEVAKALRKSAATAGPAVVFKNNGTNFALVGGVYNSRSKALIAFDSTEDNIVQNILDGLARRIPPVIRDTGPVHENVMVGDDIDLSTLPICKYSPDDGGPYITSGIVVSKDPETGIPDIGHYRFELIDRKTLSFLALPNHRFAKNIAKAQRRGQKTFRASLVIGVDPLIAYTSPIQVPDDTNDFEVAGGLRGAPVELVKCRTNDVEVPARAELVIEFEADFGTTVMEGPLGEYTGYQHPGCTEADCPPHGDHLSQWRVLPGAVDWCAAHGKSHPQAVAVRSVAPAADAAALPDGGARCRAAVRWHAVLCGVRDQAAVRRRSTRRDPRRDEQQPPAQEGGRCRSRHRRPGFQPGGMGHGVSLAAGPRHDHHEGSSGLGPWIRAPTRSIPNDQRLGSALGIDATYPYGTVVKVAGEVCGPAVAEHGKEFLEVADIPGWRNYDFPELRKPTVG